MQKVQIAKLSDALVRTIHDLLIVNNGNGPVRVVTLLRELGLDRAICVRIVNYISDSFDSDWRMGNLYVDLVIENGCWFLEFEWVIKDV